MQHASPIKRNHYGHTVREIHDWSEISPNERVHYIWRKEEIELEFLYKPAANSKGLAVIFHGAGVHGDGSRPLLPIFRMHDLSIENVSVLCVSDPVLKKYRKNDLLLSWYVDTKNYQPSQYIQALIAHIKLTEHSKNIVFVGTSGAGFSALKYACIFRQKALLSNAQFSPKLFWYYEKFDVILKKHNDAVVEALCAKQLLTDHGLPKKLIVYSNTCDTEHHKEQAMPFVEHIQNMYSSNVVELRTFADEGENTRMNAHCALWDRPYEDIIKEILFS